jgi:hypothetical protein
MVMEIIMKPIDMTSQKIHRWTVLKRVQNNPKGQAQWLCLCKCGNERIVGGAQLRNGQSKSCGCLRSDITTKRNYKHGHTIGGDLSPTYNTWVGMIARCTNPNHRSYDSYGGRGIVVCSRWFDFSNFLADMGEKPESKTIDRIDNNGNYEPSNCHWVSAKKQARNKRSSHSITYKGETKTIAEWSEILDIPPSTISWRLNHGCSDPDALSNL